MTADPTAVRNAHELGGEARQAAPVASARSNREDRAARIRAGNTSRRLKWDKARTAELFARCRATNDTAARDELITTYLNLVTYLASKYRNRGEPIEDLVQVGVIGLIKAVDRFDTGRGLEFTTYATPTIVGEIKRHFRDKGWAVKVPRRLQELAVQVNPAIEALTRELQRSPTVSEIAGRIGASVEEVLEATEAATAGHSTVPIDAGFGSGGDEGFSVLDCVGAEDPLFANVDDRRTIAAALKGVSVHQRLVLKLRFIDGMTQTQIARELGVSQMQVSRVLRQTLAEMRAGSLPSAD